MSSGLTLEQATDALAKLAKRIAWNSRSKLARSTSFALRRAVQDFERLRDQPTIFDHILDEEIVESSSSPDYLCQRCKLSFRPRRKWQKFCSRLCKVQFWNEQKKTSAQRVSEDPLDL